MADKVWRGGMIGAGAWSEVQLTAWTGVKNAEIVALCDRHPDRRDPIIKRFNIPQAFDNFETMLDEVDLNFVDICTRPYSHTTLTKLAAGRGLHILCQKPFCETLAEAQETVEFCHKAGVRLMINENFRWQAWYRKTKELLDTGELGVPFLASIHRRSRFSLPKFEHSQAYMKDMPRWAVYEVGVHYLDTIRFLFGEPDVLFSRLHRISPEVRGEDVQLITLGYENLSCLIKHSFASVPIPGIDKSEDISTPLRMAHGLQIDGTTGTLTIKPDNSLHLFTDIEHKRWRFSQNAIPESHIAAQQHFIDCLESGVEFETSGVETLKTMALVYAAYRSAETGQSINLKS